MDKIRLLVWGSDIEVEDGRMILTIVEFDRATNRRTWKEIHRHARSEATGWLARAWREYDTGVYPETPRSVHARAVYNEMKKLERDLADARTVFRVMINTKEVN